VTATPVPSPALLLAGLEQRIVDGSFLAVLVLFAVWGWIRGFLRQAVSAGLLASGLWLAGVFHGHVAGHVAKVATLGPDARCAASWGAVLVGTVLGGSVVLAILGRFLPIPKPAFPRSVGALLGLAKGTVVLVVSSYAFLATNPTPPRPRIVDDVERSAAMTWVRRAGDALRVVFPVPSCVAGAADGVNARIP
jgi:uncharacterized membrane protein required for colicin V production